MEDLRSGREVERGRTRHKDLLVQPKYFHFQVCSHTNSSSARFLYVVSVFPLCIQKPLSFLSNLMTVALA